MSETINIKLFIEVNNAKDFIDEIEEVCQRWAVEDEEGNQVYSLVRN